MELADAFRAHQREIYLYLSRVTGDPQLAEDLAQETFLRAFRAVLTFRGEATMRTWLFSIARNVLATHRRTRRIVQVQYELGKAPGDAEATQPDPTTRLSVHQTLGRMPLLAREALVLCDLLEFEPAEAAQLLGMTPNAFRVRLHRARNQFREMHHVRRPAH